jgi:dihydrofolate synthase/folylpolyglutamate synthase
MYHFANLATVEEALEQFLPAQTPRPAYTLDHVSAFLDYAGNPQDTVKAIHIAGTSGKTSTAYYVAALLGQAGKKVGLLTSPHIDTITERVQINLQPLEDRLFCDELAVFMNLVEQSGIRLTYAELLYAFGYWEFARQRVDYMVIETGLGGTLDATNVINRRDKVCVITDISLDHTNVLGNTIQEIAGNKAGIITLHNAVFTHPQPAEAMQEIKAASQKRQADLHIVPVAVPTRTGAKDLPLFQQRNFGLALATVQYVEKRDGLPPISQQQLGEAARTSIPARMEKIPHGRQTVILDGAHNTQKLRALRESIAAEFPGQTVAALVGFIQSGGRDLTEQLRELEPLYAHVIATSPTSKTDRHQWYSAEAISKAAKAAGIMSWEAIPDYKKAVKALLRRPETILVVTGSLYIHQHVRPLIKR